MVDEYNDHSLLKLIAITYWIGIFSPISHKQLKQKYGYDVVYVDTMAGSGITKTQREGDYLCGSFPSASLRAADLGCPFDRLIGVEIKSEKATIVKERLKSLNFDKEVKIFDKDILEVSGDVVNYIGSLSVSYIVIDPQAFKGMTWAAIGPLLKCKGDAMVTWFEQEAWRMKEAALSNARSAQGNADRLDELLGTNWRTANKPEDLTHLFTQRILNETQKVATESILIEDILGKHYKMILFVGKSKRAKHLAMEWKKYMDKYLGSDKGRNISRLLDIKARRQSDLKDYL
ncbi:MAG: hypothetical protein V3T58_07130 [Candidatus Hydrothermarchaeales archaeon]